LKPGRCLTAHFLSPWTFVTNYISNYTMQFSDIKETQAALFDHCAKKHHSQEIAFKEFDGETLDVHALSRLKYYTNSRPAIVAKPDIEMAA
jgi:hypothetical protein